MSKVNHVLIVGGGIGGLTAAVALARKGIKVNIIEIKSDWTVYGVGIIQPTNALRALHSLKLADACIAAGFPFPGWSIHDSSGNLIEEIPNRNSAAPQFLANNGISRSALHNILIDAAKSVGVNVRLGVTVKTLQTEGDRVRVALSDGSNEQYDIVIGADGIYSHVRSLIFGNTATPTFTGQGVWRYSFPRPKDMTWGSLWYGKQTKAGLVPMSDDSMYLLLVTAEPGNPRMAESQLHILLRQRLSEYGGLIAEIAELVSDPSKVVYKPMETMILPQPWHKGRVVLIGDAAHATVPHLAQGASIAIEDAVVLADMLDSDQPLESLLTAFAKRRHARCKYIVDSSYQLGQWELQEWAGHPAPDADFAGLMRRAWERMTEPV